MSIAYTMAPGRGDIDQLLFGVAQSLIRDGFRPAGIVQINTECADAGPCDMDVKVLPDGPVIRISQTLGRGARGCRLDPDALETAVAMVEAELARDADCLIVNKFGKHEAEGRGLRPTIAEAVAREIPVLAGLNALNRDAFMEFSGGMAIEARPLAADLGAWLRARISERQSAA